HPREGTAGEAPVYSVHVTWAEFSVVFLTLQHVRAKRAVMAVAHALLAIGSPPSSNAPIQGREIVVLGHGDGPSRLRQTTAERNIAFAHLAAQPFPGALKIPGTQTSPRSQVP